MSGGEARMLNSAHGPLPRVRGIPIDRYLTVYKSEVPKLSCSAKYLYLHVYLVVTPGVLKHHPIPAKQPADLWDA